MDRHPWHGPIKLLKIYSILNFFMRTVIYSFKVKYDTIFFFFSFLHITDFNGRDLQSNLMNYVGGGV